jgi:hypothetical protein
MTSADEYRRLARECLETARTLSNEEGRAALLQMAQVWQRLADELADTTESLVGGTPPPPTEPAQPAQQQQQIQPKDDEKE